ncbi:MAG: (Fe-S)-binding protein [Anaerolineae bacterium]|nr:(Fe-S)-binding protein [Anaerolineae bacterium]
MKIAFFVPCYVDALAPQAAIASYELLQKLGVEIDYPDEPVCCGLPFTDMGYDQYAGDIEQTFVDHFSGYDYVVTPSGICTDQVRNHFTAVEQTPEVQQLRGRMYELVEFLHDILQVEEFPWASFPHKVAIHNACHSLRYLHHAKPSELMGPAFSKPEALLRKVPGIEIVYPERVDECCGFGGTFSIWDPDVSAQMGKDKVTGFNNAGASYVVSADYSCLLHQGGVINKLGLPLKTIHIAEILNGANA